MGVRIVKHLGARSCPADDSAVLMLVPTFPGEKVLNIQMSAYFASGDDESIDQPSELNWYGISVPWSLVFATKMIAQGEAVEDVGDVADYDRLFEQYLRTADEADDNYYGGDVDADASEEAVEESHDNAPLLDEMSGPIGVHKWFSREVIMQPYAAEGNNVIRFGDGFNGQVSRVPIAAMGSLLMFGIVRFEHAAETNFNVELDDATSREAMGLLISGDYTKAMAMIEGNTAALGDYLRTVLYGGDNYIEADTLAGAAGKGYVKAKIAIGTSLGMKEMR